MNTFRKISLIVPCFNEEEGLAMFNQTLIRHLPEPYQYEIIYVNDGSSDQTLQVIQTLAQSNSSI